MELLWIKIKLCQKKGYPFSLISHPTVFINFLIFFICREHRLQMVPKWVCILNEREWKTCNNCSILSGLMSQSLQMIQYKTGLQSLRLSSIMQDFKVNWTSWKNFYIRYSCLVFLETTRTLQWSRNCLSIAWWIGWRSNQSLMKGICAMSMSYRACGNE